MGKQNRSIAQKAKVKQQKNDKKPKAVKTNLKRLNERVRDKVEKIDKLYQGKEKKQETTDKQQGQAKPKSKSKSK